MMSIINWLFENRVYLLANFGSQELRTSRVANYPRLLLLKDVLSRGQSNRSSEHVLAETSLLCELGIADATVKWNILCNIPVTQNPQCTLFACILNPKEIASVARIFNGMGKG
jgi:hypothetical protein